MERGQSIKQLPFVPTSTIHQLPSQELSAETKQRDVVQQVAARAVWADMDVNLDAFLYAVSRAAMASCFPRLTETDAA